MSSTGEFTDGDALIRHAIATCLELGTLCSPRGESTFEVSRPVVMTLTDPTRPFLVSPARKPNYRFGLAEACWVMAGSDDAKLISSFNRQMLNYSDDGATLWGAYGPRVVTQLAHVVESIKRDPDTRQAVLTTWREHTHGSFALSGSILPDWDGSSWLSKDVPCTVAWHFQLRNDRLNLTVFMRSNDVWLGLPYDLLSFTTVQRVVASMLGVEPGDYHHVVSNLHLYEHNVSRALSVMMEEPSESPALPSFGDLWRCASVNGAASDFYAVLTGVLDYVEPPLQPFLAATKKDPEISSMYEDLQAAIYRGEQPLKSRGSV